MSVEQQEPRSTKMDLMNLQHRYLNSIMDVTTSNRLINPPRINNNSTHRLQVKKLDCRRSFSQGQGNKIFRYFTFQSLFLLLCLTISLLILPLLLPPLPPPPLLLLLLPILILTLLMVLAFMPSDGCRDATHTSL